MVAVDNILAGRRDKSTIWQVNAEEDYHEEIETETHPRHSASDHDAAVDVVEDIAGGAAEEEP